MDYENFKESFTEALQEELYGKGIEARFDTKSVEKLNNEGYDAVTITPADSNIGVTLNVEAFHKAYENGASMDEVVAKASDTVINPILSITENATDEMDAMEEYQVYSEIIKENIEYNALIERHPYERDMVEGIFDLILETVITQKESVHVSGQEYPTELVKSKFLKLNYSHIEYVLGCMGKNTTKVYNIKSYLLTALFNAGSTIGSYYKAMVNHDMPQFAG